MKTYRAAIFDFDGVVADTETVFADFDCTLLNDVMIAAGHPPSLTSSYIRTLAGNGAAKKLQIVAEKYSFNADDYLVNFKAERDEKRKTLFKDHPVPLGKNIKEFIGVLKGNYALATNKNADKLFPDLEIMGIDGLFQKIIPCDPPFKKKPAPDILIAAAGLLEADIDECVYIGDNVLDMQAAKSAGMDAIGFVIEGLNGHEQRAHALKEAGAVMVVDDFNLLPPYFKDI